MNSANVKSLIYTGILRFRSMTSYMRILPDFLIIGAQKCGTSSLYRTLISHPCVQPSSKEIHYFDIHFRKGHNWYRSHFPLEMHKRYAKAIRGKSFITGEASPYYLFHPHAPRRVSTIIPQTKLIVLLRDPIARAYSHYHHEVRYRFETLPFEEAINREEERLRGELEKMLSDEHFSSFRHRHFSYLSRGVYVDQLVAWARYFDREQILVLKSEDFFDDPPEVFSQVVNFLELPPWQPRQFKRYNAGNYRDMNEKTRRRLRDYFEPHTQRLYQYLGTDFGWQADLI